MDRHDIEIPFDTLQLGLVIVDQDDFLIFFGKPVAEMVANLSGSNNYYSHSGFLFLRDGRQKQVLFPGGDFLLFLGGTGNWMGLSAWFGSARCAKWEQYDLIIPPSYNRNVRGGSPLRGGLLLAGGCGARRR
jgi:hypothetical protein